MLQERVQFTSITPEMAKTMLEKNGRNRRIDQRRVNAYAQAMSAGEWKSELNTFAVYEDGNIADGQHRLMAIWLGGITLDNCMIISDVKNDSLFDVGQARTTAQNILIRGNVCEMTQMNERVAIAKFLLTYRNGITKPNDFVVENFVRKYNFAIDTVVKKLHSKKVSKVSTAPVGAALVVALVNGVSLELIEEVCEALVSGVVLEPYKLPIIVLRNRLLQSNTREMSRNGRIEKFLITQRVIAAVISREKLTTIRAISKPIWEIEEMKKEGDAA